MTILSCLEMLTTVTHVSNHCVLLNWLHLCNHFDCFFQWIFSFLFQIILLINILCPYSLLHNLFWCYPFFFVHRKWYYFLHTGVKGKVACFRVVWGWESIISDDVFPISIPVFLAVVCWLPLFHWDFVYGVSKFWYASAIFALIKTLKLLNEGTNT